MRVVAVVLVVGCAYPDYSFTPRDSGTVVVDTTVATDTAPPPDTFVAMDTTVADTGTMMMDTTVEMDTTVAMDTSVADTAKPDTMMADTKPDTVIDTAPTTWCDATHVFCHDFDTSTAPADGWSSNFVTGGGALALDKIRSTSTPNSLVATVGTNTVTAAAMVAKNFTLPTSTTVVRMDARVLLDSLTYGGPGDLILFKVQHTPVGDGVALVVTATGPQLVATGSSTQRWDVTGFTAGSWARVRIEAVMHTMSGSAKIWINDMTTAKVTKTGVSTAATDDVTRQMIVGMFAFGGSSLFKAQFDDVSYDLP
jgi:hypothetical protein